MNPTPEGDESPEQIEAEIERTRADLSETIDAIQAKLDPAYLKEQAIETVKETVTTAREQAVETVREATQEALHTAHDATIGRAEHFFQDASDTVTGVGSTMLDTMRDNPIPTALAALGLGWLVMEGKSSGQRRASQYRSQRATPYRRTYRSGGEEYGFWHTDREPPSGPGLGERAQEMAQGAAQGARSVAREAWERVEDMGEHIPYESVVDRVSSNPLPAALAALGVGWLLMGGPGGSSSSRQRHDYERARQRYEYERARSGSYRQGGGQQRGVVGQAQQVASNVAGQAQSLASTAQDKAGDLADQARHAASDVAEQVTDTAQSLQARAADAVDSAQHVASEWTEDARYFVERVPTRLEQLIEDNPLMVGAVALAIGAAIGTGLPLTRRENEMFGPRRDELMQRAQENASQAIHQAQVTAHQVVNKVQHVVEESTQAAKEQLQERDLVGQVKDVAREAVDAAKDAANEAKETAKDEAKAQGLTEGDDGQQGGQQGGQDQSGV